ncbi:hypothetical protein BGZ67_002847 [Mortierella alpina]|nr:hypothetical protein BGZ67_002847 [Mortierella alpina]
MPVVDSIGQGTGGPSEPLELETALLSVSARQAQARVSDLEHQLFLSRRAHHALLKEHILNSRSIASSPFPGPAVLAAKISATDAKVMEKVLARRDPQTMLSEATTHLLCAETELGMLMLIMAQNAEDISGLEEEVSRKQIELTHHRQLFAHLLGSIPLGFEVQIQESQLIANELENRIEVLEGGKRLAEKQSRALEDEVQELVERLSESREMQEKSEQEQQRRVQALESTIEDLRSELAFQDFKILELSELDTQNRKASLENKQEANEVEKWLQGATEQVAEEGQHLLDPLEKQHKKKAAHLYACLVKVQKANRRLSKELSTLAVKFVRVEALNDELSEQARREREKILTLQEEAVSIRKLQCASAQQPSFAGEIPSTPAKDHDFESQKELKARITTLEIKIDELTSNLRLKELELEQAQEETERLMLQLEEDLALQKQAHQEEMQRFSEEKKLQAQRERTCTAASVTVFQNMATKLQNELTETQEKLRDTTLCWGHTKELLQKCEQSYRRRKKDLEETTKNLHEVEETVVKLSDAIGLLEMEREANVVLVRTLEDKDREMRDMEYRLRVLEEERE